MKCPRHDTSLIDGDCLVCAAEAAGRRVATGDRQCAHEHRISSGAGWRCTSCGAYFAAYVYCEHEATLELGPAQLITDALVPGVLLMLRQCADCRLIGVVGDAGETVWMVRKG